MMLLEGHSRALRPLKEKLNKKWKKKGLNLKLEIDQNEKKKQIALIVVKN